MAESRLITSRSLAGLRPVGRRGQTVVEAYPQIVAYLARVCSPEHASLLAEPNPDPQRGMVDWFSTLEGPVRAYADLDPATRATIDGQVGTLVGDIQRLAQKLLGSSSASDQVLGELLELALQIPDRNSIFVVGNRPVITSWGHIVDGAQTDAAILSRMVQAQPAPAPATSVPQPVPPTITPTPLPPPVPQRRAVWPWALLGILAALLLLTFLLPLLVPPLVAGLARPGPQFCEVDPAQRDALGILDAEKSEEARLLDELNRLRQRIADRGAQCVARAEPAPTPTPVPSPGPSPTPTPRPGQADETDRRLEREQGQTGEANVSLTWNTRDDLDLVVMCPNGDKIDYGKRSACGGTLDVDMNYRERQSGEPVENVFWPSVSAAPPGTYTVLVQNHSRSPLPYRVRITIAGDAQELTGTAAASGIARAGQFSLPPQGGTTQRR